MILRAAALVLALGLAPVTAQENWNPDSWTTEGWAVEPLDDLPSPEEMLDDLYVQGEPIEIIPQEDPLVMDRTRVETETAISTRTAPDGAMLRGLDKVSGETVDLVLGPGESGRVGRLTVTLSECRFPADNPASDAFAFVDIADPSEGGMVFSGWMLASSPALNPLDHMRYDVWVLHCNNA